MKEKQYSWRSYITLTISILVLLSWVFLDDVDNIFGVAYANVLVYVIIFGLPLAVLFVGISWRSPLEKRKMAVLSLIIVMVIIFIVLGFVLWLIWDTITRFI